MNFKNTFFTEHLQATASVIRKRPKSTASPILLNGFIQFFKTK